jgi:hypothetical protein
MLTSPRSPSTILLVLLDRSREMGAAEQAEMLLARDPADRVSLANPFAVVLLLDALRAAGAPEQLSALAIRSAAHAFPEDPGAVVRLLGGLRAAGAEQVTNQIPSVGRFALCLEQQERKDQSIPLWNRDRQHIGNAMGLRQSELMTLCRTGQHPTPAESGRHFHADTVQLHSYVHALR